MSILAQQYFPAQTIGTIPANSSVVVSLTPHTVNHFKTNLPTHVVLDSANAALTAGIILGPARFNATTAKVDITVGNITAGSITPTPPNIWVYQIQ
jgi:hypothetical protein